MQAVNALEGDANLGQIATGSDDKLLLQVGTVAVQPEIDAVPDIAVDHLRVAAYIGAPLRRIVAEEIVVAALQRLARFDGGCTMGAEELFCKDQPLDTACSITRDAGIGRGPYRLALCGRWISRLRADGIKHDPLIGQPECPTATLQLKLHAPIELPAVFDEGCGTRRQRRGVHSRGRPARRWPAFRHRQTRPWTVERGQRQHGRRMPRERRPRLCREPESWPEYEHYDENVEQS